MKSLKAAYVAVFAATVAMLPAAAQAETVIRLSHTQPENMGQGSHATATIFKEFVESASGGEIEVRILGANAAGDERQQIEKVRSGINQMSLNSEITQPSFFEPAKIFGIPYLFSSNAVAWEVLDGSFGKKYAEEFRKATGIRILGHINAGYRSFFNGKREVRVPADLEGLKIRTGQNRVHIAMVEALGANPTPIAWPEVYTSLQQGVVDGMENPPGLFYAMKFYEHQKYLVVDKHLFSIHTLMINDAFYESLSDGQKAIIQEGARLGLEVGRAITLLAERDAFGKLSEKGIEVVYPTPEEYGQFADLGRPAAEKLVREDIGDEWVDEMLMSIQAAEQSVRAN